MSITYDEIINSNRSPPLQKISPRYVPEQASQLIADSTSANLSTKQSRGGDGSHAIYPSSGPPKPCLSDAALMSLMGPNHPHVAEVVAREMIIAPPASPPPVLQPVLQRPVLANPMFSHLGRDVSRAAGETQLLTVAASRKLNAAIVQHSYHTVHHPPAHHANGYDWGTDPHTSGHQRHGSAMSGSSSVHTTLSSVPSLGLDVKPPPRVSLPSIKTSSPISATAMDRMHLGSDTFATSPALAKFALTPLDGQPDQELPRIKTSPTMSSAGSPQANRQTLPSLTTALSGALTTPSEPAYPGRSPPLAGLSPGHLAQYGPTSSAALSPSSAISPPRLPTNPIYYRTTVNRENSYSTSSDQTSSVTSAGISTPGSSLQALSPESSANTPSTVMPDHDPNASDDLAMNGYPNGRPHEDHAFYAGGFNGVSFTCTVPGCNAPPFQTQYLLNSHANVHSNMRPHFCPVENCPRGFGGQGFKRKNEMIRHGLVHQSPGYVCPFCPEQQHKYPRPDNLQRHVRVHHVDRDRDDPLLREVLAQRPEGGNRGRRRRLGS